MLAGALVTAGAVGLTPAQASLSSAAVQTEPAQLASAAPFGVLAATTVTSTGPTRVTGDLGVSPGTAVTGFGPGTVSGSIHAGDAVAARAQSDVGSAYGDLADRPADRNLSGEPLGGKTLRPGVKKFNTSAGLDGTLTLDAQNDPDAVFIVQIGSTLTTKPGSRVVLRNGAQACHVFWNVGSSATLGTATAFAGNVLANTSITAQTGASVDGRLLAHNGAVTLDSNSITRSGCTPPAPTGYLEICKKAANSRGAVTGAYTFTVAGRTVSVPVGTCTGPLKVRSGEVTVTEEARTGIRLSACDTRPLLRLRSCDPVARKAVVRVPEGGVSDETVLTITNRVADPADDVAVKVCKVAGAGVTVGTNFSFTVASRSVTVPAGPADQGGYCKLLYGFEPGTAVTATEVAVTGTRVAGLTVQPSDRRISASTTERKATVRVETGVTVVTFTNAKT